MTQEFDQRSSYLALKAHETMIAFIGFQYQWEADKIKEGVVKISEAAQAFGRRNITLTFIVDTDGDDGLRALLQGAFQKLSAADFEPFLGKHLNQIVTVSLDSLAEIDDWCIEEINIHLNKFDERQSVLVEELLLPALDRALDFKFDSVQWWPQGRRPAPLSAKEIETHSSPKSLFQRWFGTG